MAFTGNCHYCKKQISDGFGHDDGCPIAPTISRQEWEDRNRRIKDVENWICFFIMLGILFLFFSGG